MDSVRKASKSKFVIVYHHAHFWVETRGISAPPGRDPRVNRFDTPAWQVRWARELIDAGASLYVAHGEPSLHGFPDSTSVDLKHENPRVYFDECLLVRVGLIWNCICD